MAIKIAAPQPDLPNIRKHLRPRSAWRVFGWGSAATIALAAVAFTGQTEAGSKRLQLALAMVSEPVRVVAQIPPTSTEAETQRLATQLRDLAADRERLTARIAMLERNLADMTGSIKQQSEQLAAARAANTPPPAPSAPATTPADIAAMPALTPLARPAVGETAAAWPATTTPTEAAAPAIPPQAAEPAAEAAPLPPVRVAAASANEPVAAPPPKPDYGIDLGAATSLEALRVHWVALKANYGPLLVGLHPVATQHTKTPTGVTYRMVAGPLPNATEAAQLCARFPVTRTGCRPAKFSGVQLAEH